MLNWVGMGADVVVAVDWARTLRDTCAGASAAAAWVREPVQEVTVRCLRGISRCELCFDLGHFGAAIFSP